MTSIEIENVWSYIRGPAPHIYARLNDLEKDLKGYGVRNKHTDAFLTGVLPLVCSSGEGVNLYDYRVRPPCSIELPPFLRDYQAEAVHSAIRATRGIIQSPTGSGKTAMGAGLIGALKLRWVYLVPAPALAIAVATWLRTHLKEPIGELHGTTKKIEGRILVATYDTIRRSSAGSDFLANAQGLIVDEVHRAPMETAMGCILHAIKAYYRIGLSATPLNRSDGRDLVTIGLLGPVIHEITIPALEQAGQISKLEFIWVPAFQRGLVNKPWNEFYDEAIVNSEARNRAIATMLAAVPKPAIGFVKQKIHTQLVFDCLADCFPHLRDKTVIVDGDIDPKDRVDLMKKMRSGEIEVALATKVFYEGVDIPELQSIVVGTGYMSSIEAVQRVGRLSRKAAGKPRGYVVDFADSGHKWLVKHTLERYNAYLAAGYKLPHPFGGEYKAPKGTVVWAAIVLLVAALFILGAYVR